MQFKTLPPYTCTPTTTSPKSNSITANQKLIFSTFQQSAKGVGAGPGACGTIKLPFDGLVIAGSPRGCCLKNAVRAWNLLPCSQTHTHTLIIEWDFRFDSSSAHSAPMMWVTGGRRWPHNWPHLEMKRKKNYIKHTHTHIYELKQ